MIEDPAPRVDTQAAVTFRSRRRPPRRRSRYVLRRVFAALILVTIVPIGFSYGRAMMRPSSLPIGVRSVEWLRASGFAWLVNDVERVYYTHTAPKKGGPPLRALPSVGGGALPAPPRRARRHAKTATVTSEPPPIGALIRPALRGEGRWHATTPLRSGTPPVLETTFRPDPSYPRLVAYVAWIDHARTELTLYPGRYEPPSGAPRGAMEVPVDQRWRLLATFNSGFTWRDGHGGFVANGRSYEPLRSGLATLVAYRDGHVNVVSWDGGPIPGFSVVSARQNLPLIVDRGRPTAHLDNGPEWGATLGNAIRVWRSGVGVDRNGNLVYAAADHQTVSSLAEILVRAGARRAMELDINAEWPSFISYSRGGGNGPNKLVPNDQQSPTRYLVPDDRDFFAVFRRLRRVPLGSSTR